MHITLTTQLETIACTWLFYTVSNVYEHCCSNNNNGRMPVRSGAERPTESDRKSDEGVSKDKAWN